MAADARVQIEQEIRQYFMNVWGWKMLPAYLTLQNIQDFLEWRDQQPGRPCCVKTLQDLASAMKKTLPKEVLDKIVQPEDPLEEFLKVLRD